MDALEYLHGGDTVIAAMQYAYTPSWVSFVFEPDAPVEAARVLFDAVEARWEQLPEDDRPQLIAYGLSLGAHGSQAVFTGVSDLRSRADGALFVGSPNGSPLWRNLQAARDPGSPAWQPVLDSGREVRWMSRAGDEAHLSGAWYQPRVLYLQHATDPVTWLSPELLWLHPNGSNPINAVAMSVAQCDGYRFSRVCKSQSTCLSVKRFPQPMGTITAMSSLQPGSRSPLTQASTPK